MKIKINYFKSLLISSFIFISCSPIYYSPNSQNIPLFTKEKEITGTVAVLENHFEAQTGYSATKNIGLIANIFNYSIKKDEQGDFGNGSIFETGIGYYTNDSLKILFGVYGLVGVGSFYNNFPSTKEVNPNSTGILKGNFLRTGIQSYFGYKWKYAEAILSTRIINLNYGEAEGDLMWDYKNQKEYLREEKSQFIFEPAITVRAGIENVKLQLQYFGSLNISNKNFKQNEKGLTFGIHFIHNMN